jgi:hypothetical protein
MARAKRELRQAEARMQRLAPMLYRSTMSNADLADILRRLADELERSDTAKVFEVIAEAGINVDDFKWMCEQIGMELE